MIASLVSLIAGAALFGVSLRRPVFVRLLGPGLSVQFRVQRRLPKHGGSSEASFINTARVVAIVLGAVLIVLGIGGLIAAARQ